MILVGLGYLVAIVITELPTVLLLGVFVPLMLSLELAIESRRSFCVRLAVAGKFSFGDETGTVEEAPARQQDVTTAVRITAMAAIGATALTAVLYLGVVWISG